jgi:serine/threonine-protein kinase
MAPEQAAGDPNLDHRADIYAVGWWVTSCWREATPFTGTPQRVLMAHITQQPPPLTSPHGDIPPALVGILMKCLEKDPRRGTSRRTSCSGSRSNDDAALGGVAGVAGLPADGG